MSGFSRRDLVIGTAAVLVAPSPALASRDVSGPLVALARSIEGELRGLAADPKPALGRIQAHLRSAAEDGLFDAWRGLEGPDCQKVTLVGGSGGGGKWKAQLFLIPEGRSHPPHCHENLASCLVVVDGRLRLREYERLRELETQGAATLRRVFDGELRAGEAILTAEDYRNAHWFGAVGGPALAVNFKASGYFRHELLRLRNRRYLDASQVRETPFAAPFISAAEAKARFGGRPL